MGTQISEKLSIQDLKDFLKKYKDRVVSLKKVIEEFPPFQEHACSFPVSSLFHDLVGSLRDGSVILLDGAIVYLKSATVVLYKDILYEFPTGFQIKTPFELPYRNRKKLKEILYRLPDIFERSMYRNSDAFRNRMRYLKKLEKAGYAERDVTRDNIGDAVKVHDEWVRYKLSLPSTFKKSFPKAKYISMLRNCMNARLFPYKALVGYIGDEPVSLTLYLIWRGMVYSLIGISKYWEHKHLSEGVFLYQARKLLEDGHEYVNVGYEQNRGIGNFKREKFPYIEVATNIYLVK